MQFTTVIGHVNRLITSRTRSLDTEELDRKEELALKNLRLACNELRLDLRDYEYAETREEQLKWRKIARHNLHALETNLLALSQVFGAADIAHLSAQLDQIREGLQ